VNFSIVIPTYNRSSFLKRTLRKFASLSMTGSELVIVDNNSTDQTKAVISEFIKSNSDIDVMYYFQPLQGHVYAVNLGIKLARFSKVILVDDDILISPSFLTEFEKAYTKFPNAAVIGGRIIAKNISGRNSMFEKVVRYEDWVLGQLDLGESSKVLKYPQSLFSGCLSINTAKFSGRSQILNQKLGRKTAIGTIYAQDFELCLRLHLQKKIIVYWPNITVENIVDASRLSAYYVSKRLVLAGLERRTVDNVLKSHPQHQAHSIELGHVRSLARETLKGNFHKVITYVVRETVFNFGYYFLGPIYLRSLIQKS